MRNLNLCDYQNSIKMLHLHRTGRARPVGPSKASDALQWVRTCGGKVVYIGLVLKCDVKPC